MNKANWPPTDAWVYSVEWIDGSRNKPGHFEVVYSYRIGDEYYAGGFDEYSKTISLNKESLIRIYYDPSNPESSYYPGRVSGRNTKLLFLGIGLGTAALIATILFLTGSFR